MAVWGQEVPPGGRVFVQAARATAGAKQASSLGDAGILSVELNGAQFVLGHVENSLSVNVPMTQSFSLVNSGEFPISVLGTRLGPVASAADAASSQASAPGTPAPTAAGGAAASGADEERQIAESVRKMVDAAWAAAAKEELNLQCQAAKHAADDDKAYRAALAQSEQAGRFVDAAFPAGRSSLCFDWGAKQGEARSHEDVGDVWERAAWRRPSEFLALKPGERPTLFDAEGQKVEPDDIEQGELGDCYLLSSLSVLAEQEDRVEALIDQQRSRVDLGLFVVRLCVGGHWRQVLVDDSFPCYSSADDGQGPIFSHSKGSGLWVLILEKAWAKMFGSFQSIIWGVPGECLTNLTGAPCKYVAADKSDPERVWGEIHRAVASADGSGGASARGWFAVALVPDDPEHDLQKEVGLVEGHAYGVLDTAMINGTPLIKLRNPWGSCEWKGDWADGDTHNWTPQAMAQLSKAARDDLGIDDGSFWMDAADFSKYFAGVQICRASHGWCGLDASRKKHTSETIKLRGGKVNVMTLTVSGPGEVSADISVHQPDRRHFFTDERYHHAEFQYLGLRLMILRAETCEVVSEWPLTADRDVWVEAKGLKEGRYWVLIESDWDGAPCLLSHDDKGAQAVEVGVSCFHSQPGGKGAAATTVELLTPSHCHVDGHLLKRFALRRACAAAPPEHCVVYSRFFDDAPGAEKVTKKHYADPTHADTFAWLYENRSGDLRLTETVTFTVRNMTIECDAAAEPSAGASAGGARGAQAPAGAAESGAVAEGDRELTVTVDLAPGASRLVVLRQVAAGRQFAWTSKSHVELEEL